MADNPLITFAKPFNTPLPENMILAKGKRYYLVPKNVAKTLPAQEPFSIGLPLGEDTPRGFAPSFALLDLLKTSTNKIVITPEAEWLFTCGRDVFGENVTQDTARSEPFLVTNTHGEVVGLGRRVKQGKKLIIKNILDRGDYLRREEPHRKKK